MSGSASRASTYEKMLLRNKNKNKEASLVGKISSFNYFESVYSPEVTANLIFLDASGSIKADKAQDIQERLGTIKSSLPIVGEEDLEVLIRSKSGTLNFTKKNNLKKNIFKNFKSIQNLKKLNQDINFVTNFGRDVEYYTGIVFEVFSGTKEIASGGRYDDLLKSLGAKKSIPAVGAAINLKNI